MSRLKVQSHSNDERESLYHTACIRFAFVSSPKDGRKQCSRFVSCRDRMHEIVQEYIHEGRGRGEYHPVGDLYNRETDPPIDMSRLRIVFSRGFKEEQSVKEYREKLFSAKRILNFYEEIAGWKKSKITTVDHDKVKHAWLLTGPGEWMRHPQILSFATFIMKLVSDLGPAEFKNEKDLESFYKGVINKYSGQNAYASYLKCCYDKFSIIIKNYDRLFTGEPEEVYPGGNPGNFHWGGGIVALCQPNQCYDGRLVDKLKKLIRENKSS